MCLPRIQDVPYFGERNHKHNAHETKLKHAFVWPRGGRRPGRLGMLQDIITNKGPGVHVASSHNGRPVRPSARPTRLQCTRHTETMEYEDRNHYTGDRKDDFATVGWITPPWTLNGFSMVYEFATRRYWQPCVNGPSAPDYGPMGRTNNDAMRTEMVPRFRANRDLQLDGPRHVDPRYFYHGMVPESRINPDFELDGTRHMDLRYSNQAMVPELRANLDFHSNGARHMDSRGSDQWEHSDIWDGEGDFWYGEDDEDESFRQFKRL